MIKYIKRVIFKNEEDTTSTLSAKEMSDLRSEEIRRISYALITHIDKYIRSVHEQNVLEDKINITLSLNLDRKNQTDFFSQEFMDELIIVLLSQTGRAILKEYYNRLGFDIDISAIHKKIEVIIRWGEL